MTETKTAAPTPAPEPTATARTEAAARAQKCGTAIEKVLAEHGCTILPYLMPAEPVGNDGAKAMISAAYGIFPTNAPTPAE